MLFKNNKGKDLLIRVKEEKGFKFVSMNPDEIKNLPKSVGLHHKLEVFKKEKEEKKDEVEEKLADVKKDLKDDGKRNYSHDPKRKSPGRKKKAKGKKGKK